jgi:hypothetical protein
MTRITSSTRPQARALLAGTLTALLATCSLATLAQAEDAKIDEVIFDVTPTPFAAIVKVISNNGETWNSIKPTEISFDARVKIDTKGSGYVEQYAVFLGNCENPSCGSHPKVLHEGVLARDVDRGGTIRFSSTMLLGVDAGGIGGSYITTIINRCNTKPVTEAHGFRMPVDASMSANTRKSIVRELFDPIEDGGGFNGGDVNRHGQFEIQVDCVPTTRSSESKRPDDPHRTKVGVQDIDLFLSTYAIPQGSQRGPSGTQCKPLKVTTRIGTDKAGPVNAKLWRQVNGGPITSETRAMNAEALGSGKFGDDWDKFEHFTQTTTVQYKAEILGGTFAPSTPWKSITIHCNGDYAAPQTNANPDSQPPAGKPEREVKLPPAVVTPPPACVGGKLDKTAGTTVCRKTAQLPDKDRTAERLRKARLEAAERRRKAAEQADRRRQAASDDADVAPALIVRPHRFGVGPVGPFQRPVYPAPQFQRVAPGSSLARMR